MNIRTQEHAWNAYEGVMWSAIDDDSYDGAEDAGAPVGYGTTELEAINDLCEQIVEARDATNDRLRREIREAKAETEAVRASIPEIVVKALNRALLDRINPIPPRNSLATAPPCPPKSPAIP